MLINKSILGGALAVCQVDKEFPQLNCVCIEPDGTIVARNKMVLYAAEPVLPAQAAKVPFGDKEPLKERIILNAEGAQQVFKAIQPDKLFRGTLEHAALTLQIDLQGVLCEVRDGQRTHTLNLRRIRQDFGEWRSLFRETYSNRKPLNEIVFNRKRLGAALAAIEAACRYDGSFSPLFAECAAGNRMLWRAQNELTGQRVLVLFTHAEINEKWPELDAWEQMLAKGPKPIFTRFQNRETTTNSITR
jgi:hypothetical protein